MSETSVAAASVEGASQRCQCCPPLLLENLLAGIGSVLLLATLSSPAPRSLPLLIFLPLIIVISLWAALLDWQTELVFRSAGQSIELGSQTKDAENQEEGSSHYFNIGKISYEKLVELAEQIDAGLRPKRHILAMVLSSGISLFCLLAFRLVYGADHFRGYPPLLYFGPKYGDPSNDAELNIAFENDFNSYGHCVQGVLASMLIFPAVIGALARTFSQEDKGIIFSNPSLSIMALTELTASFMTIYPTYNFVKRAIYHYRVFATSSFVNNGMEWAMGFILGVSLGMLVTAFIRRKIILEFVANPNVIKELAFRSDLEKELVYGSYDDYPADINMVLLIFVVQMLLGFVLTFSVYGASILIGHSWNNCDDQTDSCLNFVAEWPSATLRYGLICVPGFIFVFVVLATRGHL